MVQANNIVDVAVLSWITGNIVLLLLFVRYGMKTWHEHSIKEAANRLSFFTGLVCHHIGNLILLSWYWIHRSQIVLPSTVNDKWMIIFGLAIATYGVFYKIRIFSSSSLELMLATLLSLGLAGAYFYVVW